MDYRIRWQQQRRLRRRKRLLLIPLALALGLGLSGLMRHWGSPQELWRYEVLDPQTPHFAWAEGRLYVVWPSGHIDLLRAADGQPLPPRPFISVPEIFNAPPAVAEGVVYVGSDSGRLRALEAHTGQLLWLYDTEGPLRMAPVVQGRRLFVGNGEGKIYSFSCDGKKIWAHILPEPVAGAPALVEGRLIVATTGGAVYAFSAAEGKPLWRRDLQGPDKPTPIFSPVTPAPPWILIGSDNGCLYVLEAASGRLVCEPFYTAGLIRQAAAVNERIIAFGSTDGWIRVIRRHDLQPLWADQLDGEIVAGPVVAGGVLLAAGPRGLQAWEALSGRRLARWKGEAFAGDLLVVGPQIFIGSAEGRVIALSMPAKAYEPHR